MNPNSYNNIIREGSIWGPLKMGLPRASTLPHLSILHYQLTTDFTTTNLLKGDDYEI